MQCKARLISSGNRIAVFLQATTGVTHPSAKKYRALNDRVARGVGYGRAEVHVLYIFVRLRTCRTHRHLLL